MMNRMNFDHPDSSTLITIIGIETPVRFFLFSNFEMSRNLAGSQLISGLVVPFSGGNRACIGQRFSMVESVAIISRSSFLIFLNLYKSS